MSTAEWIAVGNVCSWPARDAPQLSCVKTTSRRRELRWLQEEPVSRFFVFFCGQSLKATFLIKNYFGNELRDPLRLGTPTRNPLLQTSNAVVCQRRIPCPLEQVPKDHKMLSIFWEIWRNARDANPIQYVNALLLVTLGSTTEKVIIIFRTRWSLYSRCAACVDN